MSDEWSHKGATGGVLELALVMRLLGPLGSLRVLVAGSSLVLVLITLGVCALCVVTLSVLALGILLLLAIVMSCLLVVLLLLATLGVLAASDVHRNNRKLRAQDLRKVLLHTDGQGERVTI